MWWTSVRLRLMIGTSPDNLPTVVVEFCLVDERFPAQNIPEFILILFFLPGSLIIKLKLPFFTIGGMRDPPVCELLD